MKAITVMQPWALLLTAGSKCYETRSWRTKHRGLLYIHASLRFTEEMRARCAEEPLRSLLQKQGVRRPSDLPRGAIIGSLEIVDCLDADAVVGGLSELEKSLGDFRPGRWAWQLANPRRLAEPIVCTGNRGIFEVELDGKENNGPDQKQDQETR